MSDVLIGHWSTGHGYYDAFEDEWLMFRPDGTGWHAFLRPWYTEAALFCWTRTGPTTVRFEVYEEAELDEWHAQYRLERKALSRVEEVICHLTPSRRPLLSEPVTELSISFSVTLGAPFVLQDHDEPELDCLRVIGAQ